MAIKTKLKYGLSAAMLALIAAGAGAPQLFDQFLQEREGNTLVRIKGRCTVPASTTSASPGSVGDAATVELSKGAGQNVLDIRAGIISDQAKLKYLQEYIRAQCR
ncbi:hypothetical protein J4S47_005058 [Salmonella enterica]|nr:hypothetical protein [Salmonella enterica]EHG3080459.1 hypothetical protein [Salmonella enterica]